MRSIEQIRRVGFRFGLDRRRLSVLEIMARRIQDQAHLVRLTQELVSATDAELLLLLNRKHPIVDNPEHHSAHSMWV